MCTTTRVCRICEIEKDMCFFSASTYYIINKAGVKVKYQSKRKVCTACCYQRHGKKSVQKHKVARYKYIYNWCNKSIENLTDTGVKLVLLKGVLRDRVSMSLITPEMVDIGRKMIQLKRNVKSQLSQDNKE